MEEVRIGSLNVNHPFYSVAWAEPTGLSRFGRFVAWLRLHKVILNTPLWTWCHNWNDGRPARIAKQVNGLGLHVLCLQEVSERYYASEGPIPPVEETLRRGSRTLADIRDALNQEAGQNVWMIAAFAKFDNSKDRETDGATERGNAILVDTRHFQNAPVVHVCEFERDEEDKQQVRRHPIVDLKLLESGKTIRVGSAHITGYPRIKPEYTPEKAAALTRLGDEEISQVLTSARDAEGAASLIVVGMDLNENMKKSELPAGHKRRAPCVDQADGESHFELAGFTSCWQGLGSEVVPATTGSGRCLDTLAIRSSEGVSWEHIPNPGENVSDHKLVAFSFQVLSE